MEFSIYLLFLVTTAVVVLSPGAAAITIASQGAGNGLKYAFFGIIGVALANAAYFALSATGIAALLIASNLVFSIIKWIGVGYLVYLGLSAIFSASGGIVVRKGAKEKRKALFAKGFIVEFANPKALLYFAAILPQFVNPSNPLMPQIFIMGTTTIVLDLAVYSLYAYLGERLVRGKVKDWTVNAINKVAGGALLFAGFKMASVSAKVQ